MEAAGPEGETAEDTAMGEAAAQEEEIARGFIDDIAEEGEGEEEEKQRLLRDKMLELKPLEQAIRDVEALQNDEEKKEKKRQEKIDEAFNEYNKALGAAIEEDTELTLSQSKQFELAFRDAGEIEPGEARQRKTERRKLMAMHPAIIAISMEQPDQEELDLGWTLTQLNNLLETRKKLIEERAREFKASKSVDHEDTDMDDEGDGNIEGLISEEIQYVGGGEEEEEIEEEDTVPRSVREDLLFLARASKKMKKMRRNYYENLWMNEKGDTEVKRRGETAESLAVNSEGEDKLLRPRLEEYLEQIAKSNKRVEDMMKEQRKLRDGEGSSSAAGGSSGSGGSAFTGAFALVAQKLEDKTTVSKPINPLKDDWQDDRQTVTISDGKRLRDRLTETYRWLMDRNEYAHLVAENTLYNWFDSGDRRLVEIKMDLIQALGGAKDRIDTFLTEKYKNYKKMRENKLRTAEKKIASENYKVETNEAGEPEIVEIIRDAPSASAAVPMPGAAAAAAAVPMPGAAAPQAAPQKRVNRRRRKRDPLAEALEPPAAPAKKKRGASKKKNSKKLKKKKKAEVEEGLTMGQLRF